MSQFVPGCSEILLGAALSLSWVVPTADDLERTYDFSELGLTLTIPNEIEDFKHQSQVGSAQLKGSWSGVMGASKVAISLWLLPVEQFHFSEPEDVTELIADNYRRGRGGAPRPNFTYHETSFLKGNYGYAQYASLGQTLLGERGQTRKAASLYVLGGLLKDYGYSVEVECRPPANDDQAALLLSFLELNIKYKGQERDPQWEKEEVERRWKQHAPQSAQGRKFKKPIRTDHYIILTNSSGGRSFAKKMEQNYKKIKEIYPFEDVEGQKLMPVFLFKTNEEYYQFCMSVAGWSKAQAQQSKGHAWIDYYATWYESPNDSVHIHEATHQIFANRLHLNGGGSWFQEGVAEYIETSKNARNNAARLVKKGQALSLRELMVLPSLLHASETSQRFGNQAGNNYKLAALLIEFLRENKWRKDKFQDFLHAMGMVPRGNLEMIETVLKRVYGVGVDELQAKWVEYCEKR